MWSPGTRVPAGTLRRPPCRASGRFQLQATGVLSELRGAVHGGECGAFSRRDFFTVAHQPMGAERAFPAALPIGPRAAGHGLGTGIVYRTIACYLTTQAGFTSSTAQTGAVTLIQRFGSALNLYVHFHMLFLDGVYLASASVPCFRRVKAPTPADLERLVHRRSRRIGRHLERRGLLVRDIENGYLAFDSSDDSSLGELRGHSIT